MFVLSIHHWSWFLWWQLERLPVSHVGDGQFLHEGPQLTVVFRPQHEMLVSREQIECQCVEVTDAMERGAVGVVLVGAV